MVRELETIEAGGRINEDVVVADARMEVADLDGRPKERHANLYGDGVVGATVKYELGMFDTAFDTIFAFHRDDDALSFVVRPTVVVIIGRECKLGEVLVSLGGVGVMEVDCAFLEVYLVEVFRVRPSAISFL